MTLAIGCTVAAAACAAVWGFEEPTGNGSSTGDGLSTRDGAAPNSTSGRNATQNPSQDTDRNSTGNSSASGNSTPDSQGPANGDAPAPGPEPNPPPAGPWSCVASTFVAHQTFERPIFNEWPFSRNSSSAVAIDSSVAKLAFNELSGAWVLGHLPTSKQRCGAIRWHIAEPRVSRPPARLPIFSLRNPLNLLVVTLTFAAPARGSDAVGLEFAFKGTSFSAQTVSAKDFNAAVRYDFDTGRVGAQIDNGPWTDIRVDSVAPTLSGLQVAFGGPELQSGREGGFLLDSIEFY